MHQFLIFCVFVSVLFGGGGVDLLWRKRCFRTSKFQFWCFCSFCLFFFLLLLFLRVCELNKDLCSIEDSFDDFVVSKGKMTLAEQAKASEAQRKKENEKRFNEEMQRQKEAKGKEEAVKNEPVRRGPPLRSSAPAKVAVGGRFV